MTDIYKSENKDKKEAEHSHLKHPSLHTHNPLTSMVYSPEKVRFETQENEEKIFLLLRPHIIVNIPWILISFVLIAAPILLLNFPLLDFLPDRFRVFSLILWYLFVSTYIVESFLTWFFNIFIITDERLVDIDFYNLTYREIAESKIDSVQEVTHVVSGVGGTLFNFGTVHIQTAGAKPLIDFENVPNPVEVVKIINELVPNRKDSA